MKNNKIRAFKHLDMNERIQIEIKHNIMGWSLKKIAEHLGNGRDKSALSREIKGRPRKGRGKYEAYRAHCQALGREKDRGKRERLKNEVIRSYTVNKMKIGWSPEQISLRSGK